MAGSPRQDLEAELDRIDAGAVQANRICATNPGGIASAKVWGIAVMGSWRWTSDAERQRDIDRIAERAAELLAARDWAGLLNHVEGIGRLAFDGKRGEGALTEWLPPEPSPPPPPPPPATPRAGMTPKQRLAVFKRDGYRCQVPGCENRDLVVDHLVALAKGGADEASNWQTLCNDHNAAKATQTWDEFLQNLTVST